MAEVERITYEQLYNAVKDYEYNESVVEHDGLKIIVKHRLDATDSMLFIDAVVRTCTGEDTFKYSPEVYPAAVRTFTIGFYTNIDIPTDMESQYSLAYMSDIYDEIVEKVDNSQYRDLIDSINKKIKYIVNMNINVERSGIDKFLTQMEMYVDSFEEATKGLSPEELKSALGFISSKDAIEGYARTRVVK